ncbi:hypothetical protein BH11BAC5_BH11BAC5_13400 [soil metagenome]
MKICHVKNSLLAGLVLFVLASCKKETSLTGTTATSTTVSQAVVASVQAIAVGTTSSRIAGSDSLYVIGTCDAHHHTDSVAFSSLPAAVTDYLTANYSGCTTQKAFADKDSTGTLSGYVVIIQYNGKPVGLKFDAAGVFIKVLEQREGHDLVGHGWHEGGHFDDRGGMQHDSIAIPSLPAVIISYFAANYAQDTLMHAFKNSDSSIVVLSINNGVYATVFDANGVFIKITQLPSHHGDFNTVAQSALPAAVTAYLATTYPNYVFKQAFVVNDSSGLKGYVVFIDANATKYAVEFNAAGTFVKAVTVR